jgi:hypothetical protein
MSHKIKRKYLKLGTPATYFIQVEGTLDGSWSDRLAGMRINSLKRADQTTVTSLIGTVMDQAELTGVLNSLYELHLPILSVKVLNEKNGDREDEKRPD